MIVQLGKSLILIGIFLVLIGIIFMTGSKNFLLGKLPGDIYIKKGNFAFFAPLGSCLLLSLIFSLILWILFKIFR